MPRKLPRKLIASLLGLSGFVAYVAVAVILGDHVTDANVLVQTVYFLAAGVLWTIPARWLMLWSVHQR
jgi:hypothetical protein